VELAQRLVGNELIEVVFHIEDLESAVRRMLKKSREVSKGEVSPERERLIQAIQDFVKSCREKPI
jgi:hypothetical protein